MRYLHIYGKYALIFCFIATLLPFNASGGQLPHPSTYVPMLIQIQEHKQPYDDPSPYLLTFGPKQVLPAELYATLSYDIDKMKKAWSDVIGFSAPDLVGKIAPEIKPGKYTYKDLEKNPGLKELMWPELYNRIKPGDPPFVGNIPEFEVIATRQYYYALPIAEATAANNGKTKLKENGYLDINTWVGGYPFPAPSGEFKAQQIMYNVEKRYTGWGGNFSLIGYFKGYNKSCKLDFDGVYGVNYMRLSGRLLMEPAGRFDERAEGRGETKQFLLRFWAPRDVAGFGQSALYHLDPDKADQLMVYIPSLRRIRKLSATDSQDPVMGQDIIYDDSEGFMQKLSPTRYPYTYELMADREFLLPAYTLDGAEYVSSKELEFRNMKFERRPIYVVKLTQLDPNYVYSSRIFYIDKETFDFFHIENYDQKNRLYRTYDRNYSFFPEMGMTSWCGGLAVMKDFVDIHSTISIDTYQIPAAWNREDVSLQGLLKQAK